jgi:hypothetical protein
MILVQASFFVIILTFWKKSKQNSFIIEGGFWAAGF